MQGISAELNREKVNLTNRLILCKQRLVRGDTSASAEIIALEARLFALFSFEIEGVKMRSRARWIEEGEKPSRYFFRLEQERIEKNRVISMYDSILFDSVIENNLEKTRQLKIIFGVL